MALIDEAALIVSVCTIIAFASASIKWLVKHYLAELKPNGGSSIKDTVSRLEKKIAEVDEDNKAMDRKIDKMFEALLEHISKTDK
jgi:hypothetical protein